MFNVDLFSSQEKLSCRLANEVGKFSVERELDALVTYSVLMV